MEEEAQAPGGHSWNRLGAEQKRRWLAAEPAQHGEWRRRRVPRVAEAEGDQAAVRPRGAQPRIRLALENRDLPALFGEAVGCRDADNTATDDDGTPDSAFSGDALPAHDTVWLRDRTTSDERRVGQDEISTCISWVAPYMSQKTNEN